MLETLIGILAFIVAVLVVLQGWQMKRRHNNNPNNIISKLGEVVLKLDGIGAQLGRMEQRLNDIWDKIKEER